VKLTLGIECVPILGKRADMVLLETVFELEQFLEETSCHLQARLFSIHELQGLDQAPPKSLHENYQCCDATTISPVN
jgi:hypothetical protein